MLSRVADADVLDEPLSGAGRAYCAATGCQLPSGARLHDLMAQMHEVHWKSQLTILQQSVPEHLWKTEDRPRPSASG